LSCAGSTSRRPTSGARAFVTQAQPYTEADDSRRRTTHARLNHPPRRYTDDTFLLLQEHRLLENTPDETRPDPRPPDPSTTIRRLGAIFS
ncbi:hypothetical protein CPAR01_08432, partial [Colletotrichum paranaense]